MVKKNTLKYVAAALAVILLFCGCKENKSQQSHKTNENRAQVTMQMRMINSLNPLRAENQSVSDALSLCYEPLFSLNDALSPEGVLARSINISDDCKSAIITLKDSVLWHDKIKFTSADVVHTISLLKDSTHLEYSDCVKYIESAQSVDPLTVKITLSRPYGQIAYSLYFPIVAAHNENPEENIIGTGPYKMEKYIPSVSLDFKRFDSWHGGEAACESISVAIMKDNETATASFNAGIINTITGKSFDSENNTPKSNARTTLYPSEEYEFIAFNSQRKIFSSAAVRNAISCGIDRSLIVAECYNGAAHPANVPVHPQIGQTAVSPLLVEYNLSGAIEMLFLEGYSLNESTNLLENEKGENLSFTLLVNSENQSRVKCAQLLSTQLLAAGIQINIKEADFNEYTRIIKEGSYDAYIGGTRLGNIYDFEFLLSPDGKLNYFGYAGEYINLALSAIASAPTSDSLSDAVANFEEVFLREQPVCGLVFKKEMLITSESIMGKLMPQMYFPYRNIARWSVK